MTTIDLERLIVLIFRAWCDKEALEPTMARQEAFEAGFERGWKLRGEAEEETS